MIGMVCAELTTSYSSFNPPFMENLMSQKGETKAQPTHTTFNVPQKDE